MASLIGPMHVLGCCICMCIVDKNYVRTSSMQASLLRHDGRSQSRKPPHQRLIAPDNAATLRDEPIQREQRGGIRGLPSNADTRCS